MPSLTEEFQTPGAIRTRSLRRLTTSISSAVTTAMFTPKLHCGNAGAGSRSLSSSTSARQPAVSEGRSISSSSTWMWTASAGMDDSPSPSTIRAEV
jgi:hypothetical protein